MTANGPHASLAQRRDPLPPDTPTDSVLGFDIARIDARDAIDAIVSAAAGRTGGYVCVPNASTLVAASTDTAYADALRGARLILPDSVVVQRARAFLHGVTMPETFYGAELMDNLCARAAKTGVRVGVYGGAPETIARLVKAILERHPALNIAYSESPPFAPFSALAAERDAALIAARGVDLLFVGLGAPKQEKWMAAAAATLPATVQIGVGAAFDALAGVVPAPPVWLHRAGLGWLFRLAVEPGRLWRRYAETAAPFFAAVALQKLSTRRRGATR